MKINWPGVSPDMQKKSTWFGLETVSCVHTHQKRVDQLFFLELQDSPGMIHTIRSECLIGEFHDTKNKSLCHTNWVKIQVFIRPRYSTSLYYISLSSGL